MHWEQAFREEAERQHGLLAKFHVARLGFDSDHWWRAARSQRWELLSARVLRLHGVPETDEQRALAAVFDASPGAVLHGPTTLAWFGSRGYDLATIRVARSRGISGAGVELGHLHQLRRIRAHDVVVARGVPTETPLRALWAEAAKFAAPHRFEFGVRRIGRLLDDAHVRGLVTWSALHEMVDDISERGRAGTKLMRELAQSRHPGSSPTESRNEDRFEETIRTAGISSLRRQVVIGGHEPIGRVDYCDSDLPLVVEVNSVTYHSSPSDRVEDKVRYQRFNDAGFTVAVVWEHDLWSDKGAVLDTIRLARKHAHARDRVVVHTPSCPWPRH